MVIKQKFKNIKSLNTTTTRQDAQDAGSVPPLYLYFSIITYNMSHIK